MNTTTTPFKAPSTALRISSVLTVAVVNEWTRLDVVNVCAVSAGAEA